MFSKIRVKNLGWEPYVYLVYLGFLFFQPAFDPERTWIDIVAVVALSAIFLPIYFASFLDKKNHLIYISLMVTLGVFGMYLNSGSSIFFVYAAAVAAQLNPSRKAIKIIFAIAAVALLSAIFSPIPFPYRVWAYGPAAIFSILVGLLGVFQAEKTKANAKLRLAQEEIEQIATVAERERIARDLHDLLGHTLSVISLKSELAAKLIGSDSKKAQQEISEVAEISRKALKEVRAAISGYQSKGLKAELAAAKLILNSAGIDFDYSANYELLNPIQESNLSLIIREAITNIVRHSGATQAELKIFEDRGKIIVEIKDNGKGIRQEAGNGLRGMKERIAALSGEMVILSEKGTVIKLSLPKDLEEAND